MKNLWKIREKQTEKNKKREIKYHYDKISLFFYYNMLYNCRNDKR